MNQSVEVCIVHRIYKGRKGQINSRQSQTAKIFESLINITMTYRRDSTVINSFGRMVPTSERAIEAFVKGQWLDFKLDEVQATFETKEHDIAWMVSNCHTDSKREELVEALQKSLGNAMQLNIYGKCGSKALKLPPNTYDTIGKSFSK